MDIQPMGYCAGCGYPLQGLIARDGVYRCPECGRAFDPTRPRTFHANPHGRLRRFLASPMGWPLVIVVTAAAVAVWAASWGPPRGGTSVVDLPQYLSPQNLRSREELITWRDWAFTAAMLLAAVAGLAWVIRVVLRPLALRGVERSADDATGRIERRHFVVMLGLAVVTAGAVLGWPLRLAQHWIARRKQMGTKMNLLGRTYIANQLSEDQGMAMLRAAVMDMPSPDDRMVGLQLLVEQRPEWAVRLLSEAVVAERDSEVRCLELQMLGICRERETVPLLARFMDHGDPLTRAAAIDALGLVRQPAYPVPIDGSVFRSAPIAGRVPVMLWGLIVQRPALLFPQSLNVPDDLREIDAQYRQRFEHAMLAGTSLAEREAAARALVVWPPEGYRLRVAEWGVWINVDGKLTLAQSLIEEIPGFVHRSGNPLSEFDDRVQKVMIVDKPVIHITVDRPMAIDLQTLIQHGRPWFAYPMPDDFAVVADAMSMFRGRKSANEGIAPPLLEPLDRAGLDRLQDLRQGYPWLQPKHPISGQISGGMTARNDVVAVGLRWQSVIASPTKLSWMSPPPVPAGAKFAWWERLRQVPGAWLSSRGETERFLYYDGPTIAPSPVQVIKDGDHLRLQRPERMTERNEEQLPVLAPRLEPAGVLLVQVRDGRLGGQWVREKASPLPSDYVAIEYTIRPDDLAGEAVVDAFRRMLIQAGLTPAEAEGLIAAWRPQWFNAPGRRLLYVMQRADYDVLCPITIRPTPTELVRVGIVLTELS